MMIKTADLLAKLKKLSGKYIYVLIILAAGLLLILIPTSGSNKKSTADAKTAGTEAKTVDVASYETRLEEILSKAYGVGRVKVMLTPKTTMQSVYAEEKQNDQKTTTDGQSKTENTSSEQSTIATVDSGSGTQDALKITENYPAFSGAIVVCDGGGDPQVILAVTSAVMSVTGLSSDNITIIKMTNDTGGN